LTFPEFRVKLRRIMLRLEVVNASGDEERLEFSTFPVVIGRDGTCEVVLDDQKASRRHCAIESRDGSARLVDLDSRNGTYLNEERVTSVALATGDVIRIGQTRMRIDDLEIEQAISAVACPPGRGASTDGEDDSTAEDSDASEAPVVAEGARERGALEDRVVRSLGRRKLVGAVGAAVVFLLVVAGAVLWFVTEYERQQEEKAKPPVVSASLLEARAQLAELKAEAARRERIDAAFVQRVKDRVEVIGDIDFGDGTRPFQELHSTLRDRLENETSNRIAALVRRRDELIRAGDFRAVLQLVRQEGRSIAAANPIKADVIDALIGSVDRVVAAGIQNLESEADYFESMDLPVEARRVFASALDTFAGTSHVAKIRRLGKDLENRLALAEWRKAKEEEARLGRLAALRERYERSRQPKSASRKDEPTDLEKLLALLRPKLARGVTLADAGSIEPAKVLALAAENLDGKDLLLAARFGYGSELAKESDRLLLKYHGSRGKDGLEADRLASRLLASVRGLEPVPDGGFVYSRRYGWEGAPDLVRRLALADVKRICRKIAAAKNASTLLERFTDAVEVIERPTLAGEGRREVRSAVISSLETLRASSTEKLVKRVQHTAF
jgi:hypothetical protein